MDEFSFNISLSVLNHLGRNLYRNIITILGEAISNSWDADAHNVRIEINRQDRTMLIVDDGLGMTAKDFQNKFLKIGYSKRKTGIYKSKLNRKFIGRKGIGKLALLSCAQRISVLTKTKTTDVVGGVIDNSELDKAIKEDEVSGDYHLSKVNANLYRLLGEKEQGTAIFFENITDGIYNTVEYIRKAISLYFKFSLYDSDFNIFVNGKKIEISELKELANNTQFRWSINNFTDPLFSMMNELDNVIEVSTKLNIRGYIATVRKPSNLKIPNTNEKATVDLFVNGRLRERDVVRHIPTARIVENYVYGQIHYDDLDNGSGKDIFTSSREGIVPNDPIFNNFLVEFKKIFAQVVNEWDDYRRQALDTGDPDNCKIKPKERKAEELFSLTIKDMQEKKKFIRKGGTVQRWAQTLASEARFNIPSYTECFISENLLRFYIKNTDTPLSRKAIRQAKNWKKKENESKNAANISYSVRANEAELYYLDMADLANLIDKADNQKIASLSRSAITYKPLRDAIGHTSIITDNAKLQLSLTYENIKKRLGEILALIKDE